jgi:plastocyanin
MRFMDARKVIRVGETVEWVNSEAATNHTITFGPEPVNLVPPSANVFTDPDGARHAIINSPSDAVHSGFISAARQDATGQPQTPLGVTRFRVTFTRPGVYKYICSLHDDIGMVGEIVVQP